MKNLEVGQTVGHKAYSDFRGVVVGFKNEHQARVEVLKGWRGPKPTWPVPIKKEYLVEVKGV